MQAPYVRETIADRELETWLLIDQSASLDFGTANCEKRDLVLNAAAAVGFLTSRNGNRLGAMLLRPGAEPVIVPALTGRVHLQAVLHRVLTAPRIDGGGPTNLATGIERLGGVMRRRGLAAAAEQRATIAREMRGAGADHLVLRTDEDWLLDLVRFVVSRRRNRQSVAPTIVVNR
jgi:uncharacterized protein (DUF58 family)